MRAPVPRNGSSVGTPTSRVFAKVEDHRVLDSRRRCRRRTGAGTRRGSGLPACRVGGLSTAFMTCCSVTSRFIDPRAHQAGCRAPCPAARPSTAGRPGAGAGVDQLRFSRRRKPSSSRSLAGQSRISAHSIGSRSSRSEHLAHVSTTLGGLGGPGHGCRRSLATLLEVDALQRASAVSSRPSASATVARSDGSRLTTCTACTGPARRQIGEVESRGGPSR